MSKYWKGPSFDAQLFAEGTMDASTNARLRLTLKINFKQVTTGHPLVRRNGPLTEFPDCGDATTGIWFPIRNWAGGDDWGGWKTKVCRLAEKYWNRQLWLITPGSCSDLDWPTEWYKGTTHRCNVDCELKVMEAGASDAHLTIEVIRLQVPDGLEAAYSCTDFRSHMTLYDQFDIVESGFTERGEFIPHCTVAHEIGHALGLPHVGITTGISGCGQSNSNASICYAQSTTAAPVSSPMWMSRNIMGLGEVVHDINASPWQDAMEQLTGTRASKWTARCLRHGPERV